MQELFRGIFRLPETPACVTVSLMHEVYMLKCGRTFILGITARPKERLALHRYALRQGKHVDARLQRAFNRCGEVKRTRLGNASELEIESVLAEYREFYATSRDWTKRIDTDESETIRRELTAENRKRISEAKRGARNPRARRAMAIERSTGKVELFRTTMDLARFAGVSQQAASAWVTGKTPFPGEGKEKRGANQRHRRLAKWKLVRLQTSV